MIESFPEGKTKRKGLRRMKKRVWRTALLLLCIVMLLPVFSACGGDSVTVITVNGTAVKKSDLMLYIFNTKYAAYQSMIENGQMKMADLYELDEATLNAEYVKGVTFADYLKQTAASSAVTAMMYRVAAEAEGIRLTSAEKDSAKKSVSDWEKQLGGAAAYSEFLRKTRVTENALYRYYCDMIYQTKIQAEFGDYGKYAMTDEEKETLHQTYRDEYVTVDYIYWSKREPNVGLLLSEKEIAAKYALAKECLAKLKAGGDFYELRKAYSEEGYQTVTYCDGMVSETFGNAGMALRMNAFSSVVEDKEHDCYYILHRIAVTDDQWKNYYDAKCTANFNAFMNDKAAAAEIVYKGAFKNLEFR